MNSEQERKLLSDVELLKFHLDQFDKRLGTLESAFPHLRDRFEGINGSIEQVKQAIPEMRTDYETMKGRIASMNGKIEEILRLTKQNVEARRKETVGQRAMTTASAREGTNPPPDSMSSAV